MELTCVLQVLRAKNHNNFLAEQLNKFLASFDDIEQPVTGVASSARADVNAYNDAAVTYDPFFLSPQARNLRIQRTPAAIKSILEENIRLATSLQMNFEGSKETTEALAKERQNVAEMSNQIAALNQSLDASKEREDIALKDALECKQSCDAMIKDIKEKISSAWEMEEQKQLHAEAQMSALKVEVEAFESAKQELAHFKQLAAEHHVGLAHLQHKHESELVHLKLVHEEELAVIKQQHDDDMKRASAKIEELTLHAQAIESSLAARVQEEMSSFNAQFRQEQQRFLSQLESSVHMLNEAREQRSQLLEITTAKTLEIDELAAQLLDLNQALRMKDAEIESLRSERDREMAEKLAEMELLRFERDNAAAGKMAEIESTRRAAVEEAAEKQRLLEQKQAEEKQVLDSSWAALAVIRKEIEESAVASTHIQLGASTSKFRSSLELEIRQTFEARMEELQSRLSAADLELKHVAEDRDMIHKKLQVTQQELENAAELRAQLTTVEESFSVLRANLEASTNAESQLRQFNQEQDVRLRLQQDKLDAAVAALASLKNLESVVVHLNELLHQKESECEVLKRDQNELRERIAQQESTNAQELMRRSMAQSADSRVALENLRIASEQLQSCKAELENETQLRMSLQEQLAVASSNREDVMQAARDMITTERQRFDQQHSADAARVLELQLELKKCKDRLRLLEKESDAKVLVAAS